MYNYVKINSAIFFVEKVKQNHSKHVITLKYRKKIISHCWKLSYLSFSLSLEALVMMIMDD